MRLTVSQLVVQKAYVNGILVAIHLDHGQALADCVQAVINASVAGVEPLIGGPLRRYAHLAC